MKKRLMAKEEFFYDGATRKVGDEFDAVDPDANILVLIGKAYAIETPKKLQTTAIRAEQPRVPQEETQDEPAPRRRREYKRRDMVSEE